ncbi:hypothetical protein GGF40_002223 [Coemansia sp. RSA 1286]|nr:hypothetical protein GGF39_000140 [Coemansia sp. RSA 1721]KAJ2637639.1 hypothetical protein GGF40_002223 [Coemansia sp. RSA 1286]
MRVIHAVFCIIFRGNSKFTNLSNSEEAPVDTTTKTNSNTGARMQTRARSRTVVIGRDCVDNGIGHTDMHDRSSRHETVVADIVHCSSCTCDVFFE